jgi:hypothetical protein
MVEGLPDGMSEIRHYTAAGHIGEPLADRVLPADALFREKLQQQERLQGAARAHLSAARVLPAGGVARPDPGTEPARLRNPRLKETRPWLAQDQSGRRFRPASRFVDAEQRQERVGGEKARPHPPHKHNIQVRQQIEGRPHPQGWQIGRRFPVRGLETTPG